MENGKRKMENGKRKTENGKIGMVGRFGKLRKSENSDYSAEQSEHSYKGDLFCSDITSVFPFAGALDGTIGGIFRTFSMWLTVGEITNVLASIGPHVCAFP